MSDHLILTVLLESLTLMTLKYQIILNYLFEHVYTSTNFYMTR